MPTWIPIGGGRSLNLAQAALVEPAADGEGVAVVLPYGETLEFAGELAARVRALVGLGSANPQPRPGRADGDDGAPDGVPALDAPDDPERRAALAAFEEAARAADLYGFGLTALLASAQATDHRALDARRLRQLARAVQTDRAAPGEPEDWRPDPEKAAAFNENGFAREAARAIAAAPPNRREHAAERQAEAAADYFGGERLARVRAAIERALRSQPAGPSQASAPAPRRSAA